MERRQKPGITPSALGQGRERRPNFASSKDEHRLVIATLRISPRKGVWLGTFSRRHPYHLLELLSRTEVSPTVSVADIWISGHPPGVWGKEIAAFRDVVSVDCLSELGEGTLYRVKMQNPPIVYLYQRLKLPLPLPLRIQGGVAYWEVVAPEEDFQEVLKFARAEGNEPRVTSIRRHPLHDHVPLLTRAQKALLAEAMADGYFAVPREINLTELARKLGRNKSTVSERISIIEKRLLESALSPLELHS